MGKFKRIFGPAGLLLIHILTARELGYCHSIDSVSLVRLQLVGGHMVRWSGHWPMAAAACHLEAEAPPASIAVTKMAGSEAS